MAPDPCCATRSTNDTMGDMTKTTMTEPTLRLFAPLPDPQAG
jgi:hypothetical protein